MEEKDVEMSEDSVYNQARQTHWLSSFQTAAPGLLRDSGNKSWLETGMQCNYSANPGGLVGAGRGRLVLIN